MNGINFLTAGGEVTNSSTISGGTNGINFSAENGTVSNSGSIIGTAGSGVSAISGLVLTNSGTLTGTTGVTVTGGSSQITLLAGEIVGTGGVAVQLGDNDNVVALTNGVVSGSVIAGGTGNSLTAGNASVDGNLEGFSTVDVAADGGLYVKGNIDGENGAPAAVQVSGNASLSGAGTWNATINLAEGASVVAWAPNDQHLIEVNGDLNHAAGSYIVVGIEPTSAITNDGSDHSLIRSTSGIYNATDAIIELVNVGSDALLNGEYVIVEADGGTVEGGGNAITYQGETDAVLPKYFAVADLVDGDLVVTTDHNFSDLPGLTENQSSLGEALDQFMVDETALGTGTGNQALRNFIHQLDIRDLAYTQATLSGILAPVEQVLGATGSVVNSNYRLHRLTQDHLAAVRGGGETTVTTTTPATRDAKGGLIEGTSTTETIGSRGNVWGTYSHDWQDFESTSHDGEVDALTAGIDFRIAPNFLLGVLFDGSKGDINHAAGETDIESIRAAIYGTWGESSGLYVDFLAGYGDHDLDFTDATSFQALGTVGYTIESGSLKHGPFAGVEYQKVEVDAFSSDSVFPVDFDGYDVESFRGLIGYRLNGSVGRFSPYLSVAYAHEFTEKTYRTSGEIGGYAFPIKGYQPGSALLISAGTGISLTDSLTLSVGYRGEITLDDEGVESHGGSIGLNYQF